MKGSQIDRYGLVLRVITFLCGIALIILGIIGFVTFSFSGVRGFFLNVYYILFGILVCFSEMPCEKLLSCFFFLRFYLGKALFFLFLGSITFTWDPVYYLVISITYFAASGFYFFLLCTCSSKDYKPEENKNSEDNKAEEGGFEKKNIE